MAKIYINGRFLTQPITGVQRYAVEVIRQWDAWLKDGTLDANRWQLELLAPKTGVIHDLGLRAIPFRTFGTMAGNLWEQIDLPPATADGILFCPCSSAPIRSLLTQKPVVVMVQDLSYKYYPEAYSGSFRLWYDTLMPILFQNATRILTCAHCEKRNLLQRFPRAADKIRVVQNGCADPEWTRRVTQDTPRPEHLPERYLLYVGSLSQRKNIQGVLKAADILFQQFPDLEGVIVGGLAKVFAKAGIDVPDSIRHRLHFRGQLHDDAELYQLYHHAACFVFPSFYEASPMPPTEAMSAGCPVVASSIPPHHERLGDAVLYCDPHDHKDIARKVHTLLSDPNIAAGLARKGLSRAQEFSWYNTAEETLRVINEIVTPVPAPAKPRRKRPAA